MFVICAAWGLILMFVCVCCASGVVDMEAATPRGTCTLYIHGRELYSQTPCVKRFLHSSIL